MNYGIPQSSNFVINAPSLAQSAFVRKVYSLFFVSALVTALVGAFCFQAGVAAALAPFFLLLNIAEIGVFIGLMFARRTTGLNVALLYLFAGLNGAIMGPILLRYNQLMPGLPLQAALLTLTIFGGLTLYVMQTGKDFSFLGGTLLVALIGLIVTGFIMMFFHVAGLYLLYAFAGAVIFGGFVLYDTSNIMRRLAPGDEVAGAISLYLDLINLFWYILEILGIFGRRD